MYDMKLEEKMLKDFKKFAAVNNVFNLAVGVIIGGATTALVTSLTSNLINPLLSTFVGKTNLSGLKFTLFGATYKYGNFINDLINFLIIAVVVYLLIKLVHKIFPQKSEAPQPRQEELLTQIRDLIAKNDKSV